MITLNFSVDDQLLTRTDENTVAANSRLVHLCEFTFSSEWDNRGKVATFKKRDLMLSVILEDDACTIPPEILQSENKIDVFELSVCGADGNSTITSTIVRVPILAGTWDPFTEEITPTLFEQIMQKIDEVEKGEISPELVLEAVTEYMEAHPLEPIVAEDVAAYFEEHKSEFKGDKGDTGATPSITATAEVNNAVGTPSVTVTKTGTAEAPNLNFAFQNLKGVKGDKGDTGNTGSKGDTGATGNGIASIEKIATSGLVDTYTITFTNGNTTTFTVSNGLGIKSADINANGHLIITYSDDTTYDAGALSDIYATATDVDTKLNDVWKAQGELGAKNLIPFPYLSGESYTINGITFTSNDDGSITVNGTSTAYCVYFIARSIGALKHGSYILSNSELLPRKVDLQLGYYYNNAWVAKAVVDDQHKEALAEVTSEFEEKEIAVRIVVDPNATIDNLTIYPMLRLAADPDVTWQPHVPTNYELMQSDNALAERLAKFGKKLWQGNFTSGSIEVTDANKYTIFIMMINGIAAFGTKNYGSGGYGIKDYYKINTVGYMLSTTTSGNNLIFGITEEYKGGILVVDNVGQAKPITAIYGLF